ncbi:MAG: hypothetical protein ACLP50_21360 [Solirubrobacteraceae bacterium]
MKHRPLTLLLAAASLGLAACGGSTNTSTTTVARVSSTATDPATTASTAASGAATHASATSGVAATSSTAASGVAATTSTAASGVATHTAAASGAATHASKTTARTTHTLTATARTTHTSTTTVRTTHTSTTSAATTEASTTPVATSTAPTTAASALVPDAGIPSSAHVTGPTPITCLAAAGLLSPHATQTSTWEAVDATSKAGVFVDGPYTNAAQADASAQSLAGVEDEASGGLYVVSAFLTSHLGSWVDTVAKCLSATSGQGVLKY